MPLHRQVTSIREAAHQPALSLPAFPSIGEKQELLSRLT